jgi:hypothetical protein
MGNRLVNYSRNAILITTMLISNLPPVIRAKAEANREAQKPGSTEDDLYFAFSWEGSPEKYDYWKSYNNGKFPAPTYAVEDVEALVQELERCQASLYDAGKHDMAHVALKHIESFKSKYPGV